MKRSADGADRPEFQAFFRAHFPAVRCFAARQFGPNDADDIAQETMLRAYKHRHEFLPDRSPLPWLRTAAFRIGLDHQRRRRPEVVEDAELEELAPAAPDAFEEVTTRVDVSGLLRTALDLMTRRDREAIARHVVDGMGIDEIAALTGVTKNTVRQRLFRARRNLGRFYRDLGGREYAAPPMAARGVLRHATEPTRRLAHAVSKHSNRTPGRPTVAALVLMTSAVGVAPPSSAVGAVPRPRAETNFSHPNLDPQPTGNLNVSPAGLLGHAHQIVVDALRVDPFSFTETWAHGLAGWQVSGSSAMTRCAQPTECSLHLDAETNHGVAVSRTVGIQIVGRSVLTLDLHWVPGRTTWSETQLTLDAGIVTIATTLDDAGGGWLTLRSDGSNDAAEVRLAPALGSLVRIAVALDAPGRSVIGRQLSGDNAVLATTRALLVRSALRVNALGFRAEFSSPVNQVEIGELRVRPSPCANGEDDDGDGSLDLADNGCRGDPFTPGESPEPECADGIDNDADDRVDYPSDEGCASKWSSTETPVCANGRDDDGDGLADYPEDPKCDSIVDSSEVAKCRDGVEQEWDGAVDFPADPGCTDADDDSEEGCIATTIGEIDLDPSGEKSDGPPKTGLCLDPVSWIDGTYDLVHTDGATDIRGYLDEYSVPGPGGPVQILCATLISGAIRLACDSLGGTHVRLVGVLGRVSVSGTVLMPQARLCGAVPSVFVGGRSVSVMRTPFVTLC